MTRRWPKMNLSVLRSINDFIRDYVVSFYSRLFILCIAQQYNIKS